MWCTPTNIQLLNYRNLPTEKSQATDAIVDLILIAILMMLLFDVIVAGPKQGQRNRDLVVAQAHLEVLQFVFQSPHVLSQMSSLLLVLLLAGKLL